MPSADTVVMWATAVANDWHWLAIAWHGALAVPLLMIVRGWRPSGRVLGYFLVAPLVSVSGLAWLSSNPFNGIMFAVLAAVLAAAMIGYARSAVKIAAPVWVVSGAAFAVLGWVYPHFVIVKSWATYIYVSPLGLLPCPTLLFVIGVTLMFQNLDAARWRAPLAVAGVLYGAIGVFRLGVTLDWGLLLASAMLTANLAREVTNWRSVRAGEVERRRPMAGDEFIAEPLATITHAITIGGTPKVVWPWLIQMGAGSRAGWYSYDFFDNGRRPSATHLLPELQNIAVGTVFPALPGVTDGFVVLAFEPYRSLILAWPNADGTPEVTWAFVLEATPDKSCRLLVRVRGAQEYRFHRLPSWLSKPVIRLVHFAMQRKQLLEIARRVESSSAATHQPPMFSEPQSHGI